jgi:hypothetical protein
LARWCIHGGVGRFLSMIRHQAGVELHGLQVVLVGMVRLFSTRSRYARPCGNLVADFSDFRISEGGLGARSQFRMHMLSRCEVSDEALKSRRRGVGQRGMMPYLGWSRSRASICLLICICMDTDTGSRSPLYRQ